MNVALFALPRYLTVALLCAAAYAVGRALLRRITFDGFSEQLLFCIALGLGVISHLVLCIGLFGWLTAAGVTVTIIGAAALALIFRSAMPTRRTSLKQSDPSPSRLWRSVLLPYFIVAVLAFLPLWLLPLYPPTDFDVTGYHLAAPKHWLRMHAVDVTPFLRYQVGPNLAHFLFAALMAVAGDIPAQILSLAAVILIGMGLYAWGKRIQGPSAGVLAASFWMGSPATLEISASASYHALAALFAFASIYAFSMYRKNPQHGTLLMAGIFLGFAESTWLGVFSFVPAFIAAALYLCLRERRLAPLLLILAGTLLGWGPTLVRSSWFTGNPTYPMLTQLFGTGPWWTSEEFGRIEAYVRSFGIWPTFAAFAALPYSLVASPQLFQQQHGYSAALTLLAPFVIGGAVLGKVSRWLVALVIFYITCWFFFGRIMRHLLPIIPILCLVSAFTLCWLGNYLWNAGRGRSSELLCHVAPAVAALALLASGAWVVWKGYA